MDATRPKRKQRFDENTGRFVTLTAEQLNATSTPQKYELFRCQGASNQIPAALLNPRNSNTGVSSSHHPPLALLNGVNGFSLQTGGFDWFECALFGSWLRPGGGAISVPSDDELQSADYARRFENFVRPDIFRAFDDLKTKAETEERPQLWDMPDGTPAIMQPYGAKLGYGGARWVFDHGGITYLVTARDGLADRPALTFRATSLACMLLGGEGVFAQALSTLAQLGFHYQRSAAPTRVDVCVDKVGDFVSEALKAFHEKRIIKRAGGGRMEHDENDNFTGYQRGTKGACQFQIYNKVEELKRKQGPESEDKRAFLERYRWGGQPDTATRFEFRLSGEWLREKFGVTSAESLFARLGAIVPEQICEWWIRFVSSPVDRENKNHRRAKTCGWWLEVKEDFRTWIGKPTEEVDRCIKRGISSYMLLKQIRGCVSTLLARQAREFLNEADAWDFFAKHLTLELPELFAAIERKRLARTAGTLSLKEAS